MNSRRQPLLTLSPSQRKPHHTSPIADPKNSHPPQQTTPTLPRRERLNSISRLLKNKNLAEFLQKPRDKPATSEIETKSFIDICISPCSPTNTDDVINADALQISEKRFLSPNYFQFSPKRPALSPASPKCSPIRSPLYSPDRKRIFLGRGSFGMVTLCKYKDREVAVKILHDESNVIGEELLLGIRHSHLVEIYHVSKLRDSTKLVFMEFAGHCNLQQVLDTKSELDFRRRLSFCIQTVKGLHHCHQNRIVHGDVKPANVIVSPQGICKLGDFGNSSRFDETNNLSYPSKDIIGTAMYAAPEVLKGSNPSQSSDIYSFGVFLWQVHTREVPFVGEHPHVIIYKVVNYGTRPKFKDDLSSILSSFAKVAENCWRAVPSQRIETRQVLEVLQDIMQRIKNGE